VNDVDQHTQKAGDTVAMASFFPASSPFFNTQSNRLNRKRLSRRLEIANSEYYSTFQKKNESLLNLVKQMGNHPENRDILIFWQLGEQISNEKKRHQGSATYAAFFMGQLSNDLGLDTTLLSKIETFYTLYTVVASVSMELTWEHYERLVEISDKPKRLFYQHLAVEKKWSPKDLEEKINQRIYEKKTSENPSLQVQNV
jgi:hypothetical protein